MSDGPEPPDADDADDADDALYALGEALRAGQSENLTSRFGVADDDVRHCRAALAALAAFEVEEAQPEPAAPRAAVVEKEIGPYRVIRHLGRGGMGTVLEVEGEGGERVALKLMRGESAGENALRRFERETATLARLEHENVARFVRVGSHGGQPWLAMELVQGADLGARLDGGTLSPDEARRIACSVARAVEFAHTHGIVHRDLKPANVIIEDVTGRVVVVDFGIARDLAASRLTRTGQWVGTVGYTAPEQMADSSTAGAPADVWGVGALLFHCLTGRPPWQESTLFELMGRLRNRESIPSPRSLDPEVPEDLDAICVACLQHDPADRPTAAELARFLSPGGGAPSARGRLTPISFATVLLGVGLIGAALVWGGADGAGALPPPDTAQRTPDASLPAGWSVLWTRQAGPGEAQPEVPGLWAEGGSLVEPLRGLGPGRSRLLGALFAGRVEVQDAETIRVAYDLRRAGVLEIEMPGNVFELLERPPIGLRLTGEHLSIEAPDDLTTHLVRVGGARWRRAAVRADVRLVPPARQANRYFGLFSVNLSGASDPISMAVWNRSRTLVVRGVSGIARASGLALAPNEWTRIKFAPGARTSARVLVGKTEPASCREVLRSPAPETAVALGFGEIEVGLRGLEVSGAPVRTDRPALAWCPPSLPAAARVSTTYTLEEDGGGGPCLALGGKGFGYTLELTPRRLVLWRGERILAETGLDPRPRSGRLTLERRADLLRGTLRAGERTVVVEVCDPLPLGGEDVRAGYGSSGAPVRFEGVEVRGGPGDPDRELFDAGQGVPPDPPSSPIARYRLAALRLAQVSQPSWADPKLLGLEGSRAEVLRQGTDLRAVARTAWAAQASADLRAAADGLEGPLRADALARAVWASVVAGQAAEAAAVTRDLVALEGGEGARERLDSLRFYQGRPGLVRELRKGYVSYHSHWLGDIQEAASRALLELPLSPEERIEAVELLAEVRIAAPRRDREQALRLLGEIAEGGPSRIHARMARMLLVEPARPSEALMRLDQIPVDEGTLHQCNMRFEAARLLGNANLCLEAQIAKITLSSEAGYQSLGALLAAGSPIRGVASQGHLAAACIVLATRPGAPQEEAKRWRIEAERFARGLSEDAPPLQQDLARYVELRLIGEQSIPIAFGSTRPTALLLAARGGNAQARGELREGAARSRLVHALALLDPSLRELVEGR